MNIYYSFIFAIFGSFFGSFTTMLIHRLHFEEAGIWWGRSKCPQCQKTLSAWSLIPIFSWIFQGGKCRNCQKKIPLFYPIVEITFALTFYFFAEKFFILSDLNLEFYLLFSSVFLALILFFYDAKFYEVDRRISFPAIAIALIWVFFRENPETYLIGGLAGFLFYFIQYWGIKLWLKVEAVGQGDFELGLLMGLLLGWKLLIPALFLAYIAGSLVAIPFLIFQKKLGKKIKKFAGKLALPMGAFLMPSLLIFLYNGQAILDWYWSLLMF